MLGWKSAEWALYREGLPSPTTRGETTSRKLEIIHVYAFLIPVLQVERSAQDTNIFYTYLQDSGCHYRLCSPQTCTLLRIRGNIMHTKSSWRPNLSIEAKDPKSSAFTYAQSKD
jgi:hypothetical protein